MKVETLLEKLELFSDTPEAISTVRELLVQLAVRGQISDQRRDETCDDQLKALTAFKSRSLDSKNRDDIEIAFQVPSGWKWVSLGNTMEMFNGRAFKPSEWSSRGTPIIRIQNLNNPKAPFNLCELELPDKVRVNAGDFLISWSGTPGTSFGAFIWSQGPAFLNQHIFRCELANNVFDKEFLRLTINARLDEMILRAQGGVGLRHITRAKLESIRLPLPPLAEQRRIVSKFNELQTHCDRLEAQLMERAERHAALAQASLARFAENPTLENLEYLFHQSYTISPADLRRSILTLAVQGKLAPQNRNEEAVEELMARCLAERRKMNRTTDTELSPLDAADALGYGIPESWRWYQLEDLLVFGPKNGISPKAVDYVTPVRSLILTATTSGSFRGEHSKFITTDVPKSSDLWLRDGDILVQRGNTSEYVGVPAVYRGASNVFVYPDLMMKLRVSSVFDVGFVHLAMSQGAARDYLRARASGTSGSMPKINQPTLNSLPIPIPPIAEQRRIVAKVDELMVLVDALETQVATARTAATNLLSAALVELTRN